MKHRHTKILDQFLKVHDLAKFSNSQHKDRSLARAERASNSYPCVKLAKSCSPHDLAKFSNSQRKNKGWGARGARPPTLILA